MQRCTLCLTILTVGGLLLLVAGLTIHWIVPSMIDDKISKSLVLTPTSQVFEAWKEPPAPVYIEFYIFNLTNQEDVLNNGAKPKLQQVGPFAYKELRVKKDIEFAEDGTYVDYKQEIYYVFDEARSIGPENMWFMGVNLPMLSVADMLDKQLSWGRKLALNMMLTIQGVHLFNNYTVKEYLWGYQDPFFSSAKTWLETFGQHEMAARIPDQVGLFTGPKANGSNDGTWRINTGKNDISKFNEIISWNGNSSVTHWNSDWANMINGTDASMWHPFVTRNDELYMFSSEICRSGSIKYKEDIVHKGLDLYRFTLVDTMMADAKEYPPNEDFCTPPGNCMKRGVLNMSVCMQGAPIVMSQPHFYGAHSDYINGVVGMEPDESRTTKIDVDPLTGAVLHAVKYLQFNAYVSPLETFPDTLEMNATVYPIMWVKEIGGITDEGAYFFKQAVYAPQMYVNIAIYSLLSLGAFMLACGIFLFTCRTVKKVRRADMSVVFNKDGVSLDKEKGQDLASQTSLMAKKNRSLHSDAIYKPTTVTGLLEQQPAV